MNPAADIWTKLVELMQSEMTATTIHTWFDDVTPVALEEDRFVLYSPTRFKRDIIATRYVHFIQKALYELFSADFDVIVLTEGELDNYQKPAKSNFLPGTEDYTFERFVVGSSNKFAHAAARAVADNPGQSYNPLFIYGESGLGKTHLLYAIAHTIHDTHPDYKVVYIKGDTFTNELIQAIREGRNQEFREKYRGADVFLMDDVQFIAGRDSTQERPVCQCKRGATPWRPPSVPWEEGGPLYERQIRPRRQFRQLFQSPQVLSGRSEMDRRLWPGLL